MPNDIPVRQNQPEFIELLKASTRAYRNVKVVANIQTWLAVSAAIVGPLVAALLPDYKIVSALYAIGALIVDVVFLERMAKHYQDTGAKIQEVFDTELLHIPWNPVRVLKPDLEEVVGLARKMTNKKKLETLPDWYPAECGELPLEYARLICQRANMRWDATLRRRYSVAFIVVLVLIGAVALVFGLAMKWNLADFVMVVILPLLPIAIKILRESGKHVESAVASDRAKNILEATWRRIMTEDVSLEELVTQSRHLQDELYDRRRHSPTVPEFVYLFWRDDQEQEMVGGSQKLVEDVRQKLAANSTKASSLGI